MTDRGNVTDGRLARACVLARRNVTWEPVDNALGRENPPGEAPLSRRVSECEGEGREGEMPTGREASLVGPVRAGL